MNRKIMNERYLNSNSMLKRAERVIPLGSQTFSKSKVQYPEGYAPLYITHGKGGNVWDVDGNKYVDLVSGLLPVILGYCDPDVDEAISKQLSNGISFSLATELEIKLAEELVEIIPCAEMVRFGKNGTDATSAAIRLARAYTDRDKIAVCGYHGWQDWYIGSTVRNKGVPEAVCRLTDKFKYNDINSLADLLRKSPDQYAAIIMEPANTEEPKDDFLYKVKEAAHAHGALFIFDETITGFRFSLGGAQEYFNIKPDLATFGKAMGNGMPISAVVGRADVMLEMENIFFSSTFGGETLSLAAALAVINKLKREPVIDKLWKTGAILSSNVESIIEKYGLSDVIRVRGFSPWNILEFSNHPAASKEAIKTKFMRDILINGVLTLGSHNLCYAHNKEDIEHVTTAYGITLSLLAEELKGNNLEKNLAIKPIQPVFKVR